MGTNLDHSSNLEEEKLPDSFIQNLNFALNFDPILNPHYPKLPLFSFLLFTNFHHGAAPALSKITMASILQHFAYSYQYLRTVVDSFILYECYKTCMYRVICNEIRNYNQLIRVCHS